MERWVGKVAVVTGASSGIGASIAQQLTEAGLIVIGLARREDRLNELKTTLKNAKGEFHFYKCDISDLKSIKGTFVKIKQRFGRVNVLVNNASIAKLMPTLTVNNEADLEAIMKTNFMGTLYCTKETFTIMKDKGEDCHIVNIGGFPRNYIPPGLASGLNVYPSSKFALKSAAYVLYLELQEKENFRVSTINPGLVKAEISQRPGMKNVDDADKVPEVLRPADVAQAIMHILQVPRHVLILELTINPVGRSM